MEIKTFGVVGAGQMGSGIAQIAAGRGYKVVLRDIKQEFCDNAIKKIRASMEKRIAKGKATQEDLDMTLANIITTENIEQAIARAGSKAGNKGYDCALSAIEMVNLIDQL